MNVWAAVIIILGSIENMLPLIIGVTNSPQGFVFLGTVHHPPDYFYYLSQFAQGSYRWMTTMNLFTPEPLPPTFVGWSNVLTGRLFSLIGLSPVIAYHASVAILTVLLLLSAYKLAYALLRTKLGGTVSLYLFTLYHAFAVEREGKPSYGDYFNNFAVPRVRLGGVPHQLLTTIASMLLVYGAIGWTRYRGKKYLILVGIAGVILASLQPVLWAMITAGLLLTRGYPFAVAVLSGSIPALYLMQLFRSLPFTQLKAWEALQQTRLTPEHFLSATGPVLLLALLSLPVIIQKRTFGTVFTLLFATASYLLFLSPIPRIMDISHVRFLSPLTIFLTSVIATIGLMPNLTHPDRIRKIAGWALLVILTLYLVPNHVKTIRLTSAFNTGNAVEYMDREDVAFFRTVSAKITPEDLTLVAYPYNEMFPALTGRRSFHGHPLLTIRADDKNREAYDFFSHTQPESEAISFLEKYGISYIIGPISDTALSALSGLAPVVKSNALILYQVQK